MSSHINFASAFLEGKTVPAKTKNGKWCFKKLLEREKGATGGTFSHGYLGEHSDGTEVFIKASDIGLVNRFDNTKSNFDKVRDAVNEQAFERTILDICKGSNMNRVVHALDYGEFEVVHENVRDTVFYIIFEKAQGNARSQDWKMRHGGLSWVFVAMHNLSVATQELHNAKISHNDIKPSNLLIFDEHLQKLADVGRATSDSESGPWDNLPCVGDRTYTAPEFWGYNTFDTNKGKIDFEIRRCSDLYLLGSMAFFFVTGQSLTPLMQMQIKPEFWAQNWTGTFQEVLPYIYESHAMQLELLHNTFPEGIMTEEDSEKFLMAVTSLTDPDPNVRGFPGNELAGLQKNDVQRYVSLFNVLKRKIRFS